MDESHIRSPVSTFHCGERLAPSDDEEEESCIPLIVFFCFIPDNTLTLEFACREPSCGALLPDETAVIKDSNELQVDPNFFDVGYSLAARTGFQVWTGARFLLETLLCSKDTDASRLQYWQYHIKIGINVLELGAGVGVVGTSLASVGAHVLLTDLHTLVENAILPNLQRNQSAPSDEQEYPEWLREYSNAAPIHQGWAAATPLDWRQPIDEQLSQSQREQVNLIVASDCVFLVSMLTSLLDTVTSILQDSPEASLLLSFQRRDAKDGDESESFTTVNRVISEVKAREWSIECLAWRPVVVGEDTSEVFVFEIQPEAKNDEEEVRQWYSKQFGRLK